MKAFGDIARAGHGGEALDAKTKELVALAISVAVRCNPCIAYHAKGALNQGASGAEAAEMLGMADNTGAGPSVMDVVKALESVNQIAARDAPNPG